MKKYRKWFNMYEESEYDFSKIVVYIMILVFIGWFLTSLI